MIDRYGTEAQILPEPGEVEEWRPAPGYEDRYEISSFGNLRNKQTKRLRKLQHDNFGYASVCLRTNKKIQYVYIHRLVCAAFNGAPSKELNICDHIDRCIENNYYKNLHWTDHRGNMLNRKTITKHCISIDKTPIIFYDLDDQAQQYFESVMDAHNKLGISTQQIIHNLTGRRKPFRNGYFKVAAPNFD